MSIIVLSIGAGRSVAASSPWPRASNPTASTGASTSGTPGSAGSGPWVPFGDVNGFADEGRGLGQAVRVQVADDHHRGTEQLRRGRGGQPDRSRAGDVDGGTGAHSGGDAAVEPGGEDVRQHGQIEDLLQRLVLVRELQEVPVRVRHQHVLGLTADPAAHVDAAVG